MKEWFLRWFSREPHSPNQKFFAIAGRLRGHCTLHSHLARHFAPNKNRCFFQWLVQENPHVSGMNASAHGVRTCIVTCDFLLQDPIPGSLVVPKLQIKNARCHKWQLATSSVKPVRRLGFSEVPQATGVRTCHGTSVLDCTVNCAKICEASRIKVPLSYPYPSCEICMLQK